MLGSMRKIGCLWSIVSGTVAHLHSLNNVKKKVLIPFIINKGMYSLSYAAYHLVSQFPSFSFLYLIEAAQSTHTSHCLKPCISVWQHVACRCSVQTDVNSHRHNIWVKKQQHMFCWPCCWASMAQQQGCI